MTEGADRISYDVRTSWLAYPGPAFLIYLHVIVSCLSMVYVSEHYQSFFKISLDTDRFFDAALSILIVALISPLFTLARFSFGYIVGFYFYTMILGFIWLSYFTSLNYDHFLARVSAVLSLTSFLLPALFITLPLKPIYQMSERSLERILYAILILAAGVIVSGATYNFRLVSLFDIYNFRSELQLPTTLQYLIGICAGALLPFAFACFAMRHDYRRMAIVLVLLLLLYPITLSKVTLFAPAWLLGVAILSMAFEARIATILSLMLPMLGGLVLISSFHEGAMLYFGSVNFRMIAIPASALDYYSEFFSKNELTYFCQISLLKPLANCPYNDQLSIVMARAYNVGNFNGSLFTTEGVASVGLKLAPISALACGLVIAFGNCLSAHLPLRFVLMSGAILPQVFLNVPLTTTLVSNGAALLFLLWYLVPAAIIEPK